MAINWDEIAKNPDKNHKVLGTTLLKQKKKIEDLEAKNKEFAESRQNINEIHDSMMAELEYKDKIINDAKKESESINKKNESLQNTIIDQEKEISNLNSKIEELENKGKENDNLKIEYGQLKSELEQNQSELQKVKNTESELQNELQKVRTSELDLKSELKNIKEAETEQKAEIQKYQEKEKELTSELQNLKNEFESVKENLPGEEHTEQIENLKQELSNAKEEIIKYKQTIDQNNEQKEDLNRIIKEKEIEIEDLKQATSTMTSELVSKMSPVIGREDTINTIQNLLIEAKSSILIVAPDIKDIQDIPIQELRQAIRIDIATGITEKSIYDHMLEVRPSVRIRDNPNIDRWGIAIDGEKLFFAAADEEPVGFITTNKRMIDFISAILTESWVRARRL
ncbi:MAG: hypothetical protein ACFFCM_04925 [Promethearchaeota archaeon]